ncbi:hypothetical protein GIV38_20405 [Pseudomonas syringae]|nr:hypothetical protein [Pseudomonas syringae]
MKSRPPYGVIPFTHLQLKCDGYEWQQAGTDLILVTLATGLIYEVLNGAFD